jgi:hypothetical protein
MEWGTNDLASFTVGDLQPKPGVIRSALTTSTTQSVAVAIPGFPGSTQSLSVVIVTINDLAGNFIGSNLSSATATVLHELGHVYNDLFGPNAAPGIHSDTNNTSMSEQNQQTVEDACGLHP